VTIRAAQHAAELDRLLQTAAYLACQRFDAQHLVVDRTGELTHVLLKVAGSDLVDLWTLDPLLWDDAHWAATRAVAAGELRVVAPVLHNG
jgi:hypothetical protein